MSRLIQSEKLLDVTEAAKYLLGCEIVRTLESGETLKVKIVETESYHQTDPASHTFSGESPRNTAMFGNPGHAYIYFSYGMHWCFNVTAGPKGYGAGVLIRAAEPVSGIASMEQFRKTESLMNLCSGPAKLAQALKIDKSLYGHDLTKPPIQIYIPKMRNFEVVATTRVGIRKAMDEVARFYIKDSPFISKP